MIHELVFQFISETKAEAFLMHLADEYDLDCEVEAYLHVSVPTEDFDEGKLEHLVSDAEEHCGDVLL